MNFQYVEYGQSFARFVSVPFTNCLNYACPVKMSNQEVLNVLLHLCGNRLRFLYESVHVA